MSSPSIAVVLPYPLCRAYGNISIKASGVSQLSQSPVALVSESDFSTAEVHLRIHSGTALVLPGHFGTQTVVRLVNSLKNVLAKRTVFSYIWSIGLDDRPNGLGRPGRFAGLTGRGTQKEKGRVCKTLFGGSIPSRASNPSKIWSTKYPETFLKSIALVRDDRRLCSAKPSQPDLHSLALYPMHFIPGLCARHVHLCCEPICSHLSNLPARSFLMASAPCAH